MAVDFSTGKLQTETLHATNGKLLIDGTGKPVLDGQVRCHWDRNAASPSGELLVEKGVSDDDTARTSPAYRVPNTVDEHLIVPDGSPVRVSGNGTDVVIFERLTLR